MLKRTKSEIEEQLNKALDALDTGSKYPGMSYEEGVSAALDWVIGNIDDRPMDDE